MGMNCCSTDNNPTGEGSGLSYELKDGPKCINNLSGSGFDQFQNPENIELKDEPNIMTKSMINYYFHNVKDKIVKKIIEKNIFKYQNKKLDKVFTLIGFESVMVNVFDKLNKNDGLTKFIIKNTNFDSFCGWFQFDNQESFKEYQKSNYVDFQKGKAAGRQVMTTGGCYEGFFKDGKYNGRGRLIYPHGDFYEGFFTDGIINGSGKFETYDGSKKYEGEFREFEYHGNGILITKESDNTLSTYTGLFKNGKEEAEQGLYITNKFSYFGKFTNGKFNDDKAIITFKNGDQNAVSILDKEISSSIYEQIKIGDDSKFNNHQFEDNTIVGISDLGKKSKEPDAEDQN